MAKARRNCPQCGLENVHVRTRICPKCGYEFYSQKGKGNVKTKTENSKEKIKSDGGERGKKKCPKCSVFVGVRTKVCLNCGHRFIFNPQPKNKIKTEEVIDWQTLKRGDRIRVFKGYGPVFPCQSGDQWIGYYGTFFIDEVHDDGLLCRGGIKNNTGAAFIYMGPDKKLGSGTYLKSHKIELIK